MRMRNKPWAAPELNACPFFVREPQKQIGRWHSLFPREQPLHLELGCGKGFFLAGTAPLNPQINFLGIDMKDAVLAPAKRKIEKAFEEAGKPVDNVILTVLDIERILTAMNSSDSVEKIYILFCNPWPKPRHRKRRLTYPRQLEKYKELLVPGGELEFKTDDDGLFHDTIGYLEESGFEIVRMTRDLHAENPEGNILTEHELMFTQKGTPIKALTAKRKKIP